jgi:uncharacterized protein (TIGR00725 family)
VCGASTASDDELDWAEDVGRLLAEAGAIVVTGGLGGVMSAAAKGAREAGGMAIGILPGDRDQEGNEFNTVAIATGLGEARNTIVVNTANVLIAVGGEFGTLSEIAFALRNSTPVIGLQTWELKRTGIDVRVERAGSAEEAVKLALSAGR